MNEESKTILESQDEKVNEELKEEMSFSSETQTSKEKTTGDLLLEKEKEVQEYKDKWLRAEAQFDNYKKRIMRERLDSLNYGHENITRQLLSVIDNFERFLEHANNTPNLEMLIDGIRLVHKQFLNILEKFGVKPINSIGEKFDPNIHEALLKIESSEHEPDIVIQELEKGYFLKDRILRPAKVGISQKKDNENKSKDEGIS